MPPVRFQTGTLFRSQQVVLVARSASRAGQDGSLLRVDERDAEASRLQGRLRAVEKQIAEFEQQEMAVRDEMRVP